jgi:hypothetical protein
MIYRLNKTVNTGTETVGQEPAFLRFFASYSWQPIPSLAMKVGKRPEIYVYAGCR